MLILGQVLILLEKEKERLEAEEKEATEGKNDESDAMNGNQRANR